MAEIVDFSHYILHLPLQAWHEFYKKARRRGQRIFDWWWRFRTGSYLCGVSHTFSFVLGVCRFRICMQRGVVQLNISRINTFKDALSPSSPGLLVCVYIWSVIQIPIAVGDMITAITAVESRDLSRAKRMTF